jgi:peptidoglycan/LPS O-acetylase OafA/YrhL
MPAMNDPISARYHLLDAWRGVACLLIILTHSTAYTSRAFAFSMNDPASWVISATERMWIGVPLFFVISGYCISAAADASRRRGHSTYTYFLRRVRRIYPPYLICFVACIAVVIVGEWLRPGLFCDDVYPFPHPAQLGAWRWLGNLTLTEGWRGHFVGPKESAWLLGPAWSLGFEEQFYALTGLILLLAPNRLFSAAAAVTVLVIGLQIVGVGGAGLFIDGRWLHFAAGVLVYYIANYAPRDRRWLYSVPLVLGVLWALSRPAALVDPEKNPWQDGLAAFSFALILIALQPFDGRVTSVSWLRPLSSCGLMCYSIYLVHWPICKILSHLLFDLGLKSPTETLLITVPLCLIASLSAGWLFHIWIERRFLNTPLSKHSHQPTTSVVAA